MGGGGTPKKSQMELAGDASTATQRLRDIRREDRRKAAVRTRQAGRLALLGAPEANRQPPNPRTFVGGGPQPAAAPGV